MSTTTMSTATITPTSSDTSIPTSGTTNIGPMQKTTGNSPLLFFVALGFGVLFTNLWIIIGVKYCFRYQNARRRGLTMGADGVAMGDVNHRRRRREKKLMTMEEVQAQFPQTTYKSWRANRELAGLPTEGGVQAINPEEAETAREVLSGRAPSIRAPSIRSRAASMHSIEPVETTHSDIAPQKAVLAPEITEKEAEPIAEITPEDDEVPEHLPENLGSGDTCAICIDQLDDDDEIRGLTCGHAFHCSCVDVWLTTRRAICPLCKKDYYIRKTPVVEPEPVPEDTTPMRRITNVLGQIFPIRDRTRDLER